MVFQSYHHFCIHPHFLHVHEFLIKYCMKHLLKVQIANKMSRISVSYDSRMTGCSGTKYGSYILVFPWSRVSVIILHLKKCM